MPGTKLEGDPVLSSVDAAAQGGAVDAGYLEWFKSDPIAQAYYRAANLALGLSGKHGQVVGDFGCGTGVNFQPLGSTIGTVATVFLIDQDPKMTTATQAAVALVNSESIREVKILTADCAELPQLANQSFDGIQMIRILMHNSYDHTTACLKEAKRLLQPGARLVIVEPDWPGVTWSYDLPTDLLKQANQILLFDVLKYRMPGWDIAKLLPAILEQSGFVVERNEVIVERPLCTFDDMNRIFNLLDTDPNKSTRILTACSQIQERDGQRTPPPSLFERCKSVGRSSAKPKNTRKRAIGRAIGTTTDQTLCS